MDPDTGTILLVEDDPIYGGFVRSSLKEAFEDSSVHQVSTVEGALNYIQAKGPYEDREQFPMPEIVLLDLTLSGSSGFPVLAWLQSNGQLADEKVRVIIMTASSDPRDLQQALKLGAISFLIKAPTAGPLIDLVRKFLPSNPAKSPAQLY